MGKLITIKLKREMLLTVSLFFYLTSNMWINIFSFLPISSIWFTIMLIYLPLILYCVLEKKRPSIRSFAIIFISMLLFLFAYITFPENAYYFSRPMYGVGRVFRPDRPIYIVLILSLFKESEKLLEAIWWSCLAIFLYGCLEFRNAMQVGYWQEYNYAGNLVHFSYSLSFGYKILLPCLVFGYTYYIKKGVINAFLCVCSLLMILIGGSRGQLLCIFIFVALMMLKSYLESKSTKKIVLIVVLFILILIVRIYGINNILMQISLWMQDMGITSRTLEAMLTGNIADDNSRFRIWGRAIEMINEGGFWGYGVYGDRPVISSIHYAGYCHNIFLELMVSFGLWPGLCISIFMIIRCIDIIFKAKHDIWYDLFILFFSISCQLFLSMSFWYVVAFWVLWGLSTKCTKK